ncbi:hypothetical protein VNO77_19583 [Canavalia gladiata]|uniref:Uncharacterized protein n=1 Tax=Canavalia gladiata TaxID=3824 RepID=A0AAN9LR72_CANGL
MKETPLRHPASYMVSARTQYPPLIMVATDSTINTLSMGYTMICYKHLQIDLISSRPPIPLCISENGDFLLLVNYTSNEAVLYNRRDDTIHCIEYLEQKSWMYFL